MLCLYTRGILLGRLGGSAGPGCREHTKGTPDGFCSTCTVVELGDFIGGATGGSQALVRPLDSCQKKRLIDSRLEAYKRRAIRLAFMDGFLPKLLVSDPVILPTSPDVSDSENSPDVDAIKTLHVHSRDFRIRLQESDHTYCIDGRQTKGSVTGMIHASSTPFDADSVIAKMVGGGQWPRPGYLKREVSFTSMSRLRLLCPELLDCMLATPEMMLILVPFYETSTEHRTCLTRLHN